MKNIFFRNHYITLWIFVFAIMIAIAPSKIWAGEERHHDAHVHGVAHLNVATEGTSLHLGFTSPAANIVGFEHQPRTPKQKDSVKKATQKLKDGSILFIPSSDAQCRLSESSVKTDIEHDADHDTDEKHEHEKDTHHGKAKEHHEESEDEHARHSEFHSEYQFVCKNPGKLTQMDVMLFEAFPGIEHIEVQLLTGKKQSAQELTAQNHRIKF